jgi:PIN domain nuclease of toxin-antitoxin system
MRVLLDTHILLWWLDGDRRLSSRARTVIQEPDAEIFFSAASAWEITTKYRIGKLPGAATVAADVAACLRTQGFLALSVTLAHGEQAGRLPGSHRDPFDRMLAAQSLAEDLPIVSSDQVFDTYRVPRIW